MSKRIKIVLGVIISISLIVLSVVSLKLYSIETVKALPALNQKNQNLNRSLEANYDSLNRLANLITEEYKDGTNDIGPYNLSTKNTSDSRNSSSIKEKAKYTNANREIISSIKGKVSTKDFKQLISEYTRVDKSTKLVEEEKSEIVQKYNTLKGGALSRLFNKNISSIE